MPIVIDRGTLGHYSLQGADYQRTDFCADRAAQHISLGLVNNMPDPALRLTEQQFIKLIDSAAEESLVHLTLYTLPNVPRTDWGRMYVRRSYRDVAELKNSHLDGLIITGTEPRAPDLRMEPYWSGLTEMLDWAESNTISTVCSCLAAHAAVLHIDGIGRAPLGDKCFGIFEQVKVSEHPIFKDAPTRFQFPHSRWNGLTEEELISRGYTIFSRSAEAGVDSFAKQRKSLFIFFQGHPEYEALTLLGEYRRDIRRFLRGESDIYPKTPRGYFDDETEAAFVAFQGQAAADRREELLATFPTALAARSLKNTWQDTATRIYRNWLSYILTCKTSGSVQPMNELISEVKGYDPA